MDQETKTLVEEQAKALVAAPSCYAGLKEKARAYLDAEGAAQEAAAKALAEEAEADITSIDGLIAFAGSEAGEAVFGSKVQAAAVAAAAEKHKAEGGKYCICDACAACEKLLAVKDAI